MKGDEEDRRQTKRIRRLDVAEFKEGSAMHRKASGV
jgi:hypothetical protein